MGRIITLDTEVMVIAAGGKTAVERGKERALQMIEHHAGRGDDIYLPAPALAECCHGVERNLLSLLRVAPFDAPAAFLANRLIPEIRAAAEDDRGDDGGPTRENLKVDAMILATAEALGADIFYVGEDSWFARVREALDGSDRPLKVEIRELPPFEPQAQELPMED